MRKMTRIAAGLAAMALVAVMAGCKGIPEYLTVSGTTITGCDKDRVPANLVIPKGITEIGFKAFNDCTSLESVTIPAGVTEIGANAFKDCTSLESVTIPASVKAIRSGAFSGCENIKTVKYRGKLAQWCQIDNISYYENTTITLSDVPDLRTLQTLVIPDGVTSIGIRAFAFCKELTSVSIPASVKIIDYEAFSGCENIKTVQYRGKLAQWCQVENCFSSDFRANTTITLSDVPDLRTLKTLVIPDGVTSIGSSAFAFCKELTSVSIPASVKTIGYEAFTGCTSLESVTISAGVTEIGGSAFEYCTSLKSVTIPETVTEIDIRAFNGCSLESVTIPSSVRSMGAGAFWCSNIRTVKYNGTKAQWREISIHDIGRPYDGAFLGGVVHFTDGDIPANQD